VIALDRKSVALFVVGGLLVALGLALFVSPFASSSPDGLNRVAIDAGFADTEKEHALQGGPLAGYEVEGVEDERLSTGLSGVIGVATTFGIASILFGALRVSRSRRRPEASSGA
jgi:cobalt/nickel transport system permease protein/cobalt/nickel transport protein